MYFVFFPDFSLPTLFVIVEQFIHLSNQNIFREGCVIKIPILFDGINFVSTFLIWDVFRNCENTIDLVCKGVCSVLFLIKFIFPRCIVLGHFIMSYWYILFRKCLSFQEFQFFVDIYGNVWTELIENEMQHSYVGRL